MLHEADICWSNCGCRLMLLVRSYTSGAPEPYFSSEQLFILLIC